MPKDMQSTVIRVHVPGLVLMKWFLSVNDWTLKAEKTKKLYWAQFLSFSVSSLWFMFFMSISGLESASHSAALLHAATKLSLSSESVLFLLSFRRFYFTTCLCFTRSIHFCAVHCRDQALGQLVSICPPFKGESASEKCGRGYSTVRLCLKCLWDTHLDSILDAF